MKTFVYIDHFKDEVQPASWEALGLAKSLGTASAIVFGSGVDAIAKAAFEYGADEVLVADDAALTDYLAEPYAATLSALASAQSPDLMLFPTTARTRELAAMSAREIRDVPGAVLVFHAARGGGRDRVRAEAEAPAEQTVFEVERARLTHPRANLPEAMSSGDRDRDG